MLTFWKPHVTVLLRVHGSANASRGLQLGAAASACQPARLLSGCRGCVELAFCCSAL